MAFSPLIYGNNLDNISLIGRGTLDGQERCGGRPLKNAANKVKPALKQNSSADWRHSNAGYQSSGSGGGGRETQFAPTLSAIHELPQCAFRRVNPSELAVLEHTWCIAKMW